MYRAGLFFAVLLSWIGTEAVQADVVKASDWIDRVVVTSDGELLGRVEDFALESEDVGVKFVVVAIGSFLIDDNLIAVAPDALEVSADGEYLIVYTDDLAGARRFGPQTWPSSPDVLASAERSAPPTGVTVPDSGDTQRADDEGVATISDGRRTAVIRSGDVAISVEHDEPGPAVPTARDDVAVAAGEPDPTKLPLPSFAALDRNDDGELDRREIGARLAMDESFADLDLDQSGTIDSFEFDLFAESRR